MSPAELEINLAALKRSDPFVRNIVETASQVALYNFIPDTNEWEKTEVEGCMFVYSRSEAPVHGFTIMNRLNTDNHIEAVTKDLELQVNSPYLLYKNREGRIRGIWFYVDSDCLKIANLMKKLIEGGKFTVGAKSQSATQIATQPHQPYKFGQPKVAGQDILSILSKATTEYDARGNSTQNQSPPVDGHMIIKPTPVRIQNGRPPTEIVRMEVAGPSRQPLTVAELFGSKNGEENGRPNRQSSNGSIISTIEAPVVPDLLQRLLSSSNSESLLSSISSGSRVGELEKKLRTTQFVPKSTATESQKSEQKPNSSHPPVTQSFSDFIFDNSEDLKVPITSSHLLKPLSMNTDVDADMVKFFLPSPLSPPLQADCGIVASATPLITPIDLLNCQSSEGSAAPSHCGDGMATPNADNSLTLDIETSALNYSLDNNNDLMPIGENNTIAPLTKGQMVQAFRYLLKNDQNFVAQLHQAYLNSLNEGFGLPTFNGGFNSTLK